MLVLYSSHAGLDPASGKTLTWIPAFAGMTLSVMIDAVLYRSLIYLKPCILYRLVIVPLTGPR
jgi:hypothetical protein